MNKTELTEAKELMKSLLDKKAADLETVRQKQEEYQEQAAAAEVAINEAAEAMNVEAYEAAKAAKQKALLAFDMYSRRFEQISRQEYISEANSDKVIDGLLAYEDRLAEEFKTAAADHLQALSELLNEYQAAVYDTETTMTAWQRDIHANYRTFGRSGHFDEFTGKFTDRSLKPEQVHIMQYNGCMEAERLRKYLEKEYWIE